MRPVLQVLRQKFVGEKVGKAEHVHAEKVEKEIAKAIGGEWEEDNKFYDAKCGKGRGPENAEHFVEVKSLLKGSKTSISVHADAIIRKADGMAKHPDSTYHTVAVDERETFGAGEYGDRYSGHRIYYKRGSGRYSLSQMHPVDSMAELKKLIKTPDDELPEKARGDLPTGKRLKELRRQAEETHQYRILQNRKRRAEGKI